MGLIRTIVVDDSPEFLEAAQRFLQSDTQIELIGKAHSGKEALELVIQNKPDLVLMDLTMPGMGGLEATRNIKALKNPPQVIILTLYDNSEYRTASQSVQADGFVSKSDFGSELLPLIRTMFENSLVAEP